ncbi:MAG TPA: PIN domain-containing protein [Bradyrhizobium sp.]|nr:PIN domain-containing protein [Bradyrhizobium sp.]
MSVFVDTSVWFAAAVSRDRENERAKSILQTVPDHVTTDHVLVETWLLLNSRYRRDVAEQFWDRIRRSRTHVELITTADMERAWAIGTAFGDQNFSIVDRTSFAVMERLGITQAASFDNDFSIYRFGRAREKAFEVVQTGHSETFRAFHRAIIDRKQITCRYNGAYREICPHILGHTDGVEKALVYQFAGDSTTALPPRGEWRCLLLSEVRDLKIREGRWHSGSRHRRTQKCVADVYVDVNTAVPNQPGRR